MIERLSLRQISLHPFIIWANIVILFRFPFASRICTARSEHHRQAPKLDGQFRHPTHRRHGIRIRFSISPRMSASAGRPALVEIDASQDDPDGV